MGLAVCDRRDVVLKVVNTTLGGAAEMAEVAKMQELNQKAPGLYEETEDGGHTHVQRILAVCEGCELGNMIRDAESRNQDHIALAARPGFEQLAIPGGKIVGKEARDVSIVVSEFYSNCDLYFWLKPIHANASVQARFFTHLVKGLAHMMRHGIAAHRDIKAENVFIDGAGRLAVGDLGRVKFYELDEAAAAAGVAGAAAAAQHAAAVQTGVHTDFGAGNRRYMSSDYAENRRHNPAKEDVYCCGTLLAMMCGGFTHKEYLDDAINRQATAENIRRKGGEPLSRVYTCLVDKRPDMFLLEDIVNGRAAVTAAVAAGGPDEERQWREIEAKAREGWYDRESRRGRLPDEGHFNTIWRDLEWLRTQLPASDDELKEAMPANFDMRLAPTLSDAMDHG